MRGREYKGKFVYKIFGSKFDIYYRWSVNVRPYYHEESEQTEKAWLLISAKRCRVQDECQSFLRMRKGDRSWAKAINKSGWPALSEVINQNYMTLATPQPALKRLSFSGLRFRSGKCPNHAINEAKMEGNYLEQKFISFRKEEKRQSSFDSEEGEGGLIWGGGEVICRGVFSRRPCSVR